jgi:hypothetical protein
MAELRFEIRRGIIIDHSKTKPINEAKLNIFKKTTQDQLKEYIDRINASGGYILIEVAQDGETFGDRLMGCSDGNLFAEIMDKFN